MKININERIKKYRIASSLTQNELSEKSGISLKTLQLFENGADIKLSNLIKIIEALGLSDNLELLVPDLTDRPSYQVNKIFLKKRVKKSQSHTINFKWGDEK